MVLWVLLAGQGVPVWLSPDGAEYQLTYHPYTIVFLLLACFVISVAIRMYGSRLFPVVERLWVWMVLLSFLIIAVTAVIDHHRYKDTYSVWEQIEKLSTNLRETTKLLFTPAVPTVTPPIDFQYLDRERIDSLYNQILPEMIEKERSVSTQSSRSGRIGVSTPALSGDASGSKTHETMSQLERVDFSAERKCIEIINFTLKNRSAHYYTNGPTWFLNKTLEDSRKKLDEMRNEEQRGIDPDALRKIAPVQDVPAPEQLEDSRQKVAMYNAEFVNEMTTLTGLVLLDSEFQISGQSKDDRSLTMQFSKQPRDVRFKVALPSGALPNRLGNKVRLRVFANVDQPLNDKGIVAMRALAIY